nr:hypothetical protein Iba_chr04aCG19880 [Ipomoea batatas]
MHPLRGDQEGSAWAGDLGGGALGGPTVVSTPDASDAQIGVINNGVSLNLTSVSSASMRSQEDQEVEGNRTIASPIGRVLMDCALTFADMPIVLSGNVMLNTENTKLITANNNSGQDCMEIQQDMVQVQQCDLKEQCIRYNANFVDPLAGSVLESLQDCSLNQETNTIPSVSESHGLPSEGVGVVEIDLGHGG